MSSQGKKLTSKTNEHLNHILTWGLNLKVNNFVIISIMYFKYSFVYARVCTVDYTLVIIIEHKIWVEIVRLWAQNPIQEQSR